jgi:hypothetical protein
MCFGNCKGFPLLGIQGHIQVAKCQVPLGSSYPTCVTVCHFALDVASAPEIPEMYPIKVLPIQGGRYIQSCRDMAVREDPSSTWKSTLCAESQSGAQAHWPHDGLVRSDQGYVLLDLVVQKLTLVKGFVEPVGTEELARNPS